MVAFVENFEFAETALRGRAQRHRSTFRGVRCLNSNRQANLRSATYDGRRRLESCSKDPIGFKGGVSAYSYVGNRPIRSVDPSGLVSITVEIKAFISSRHDPDGDGFIPMIPWDITRHYFGTDKRLGGRPGTSRLNKFVAIDSCDIGSDVPFHTPARSDATRWGEWDGSKVVHTATKTGIPEDKSGVWKRKPCTSYWGGKIAAKIPFIKLAPSIMVDGEVEFAALPSDVVTVTFDLSVSRFPDFELYVKADGKPCNPMPVRTYYSSFTHPSYGVPYSKLMGMRQDLNFTFTCAAPTPCRCKGSCK